MTARQLLKSRFGPFRYPMFRQIYSAQALSLIGNWMQEIARSWIVLGLAGKASAIGALLFAQAVPGLIFGTFGGTIADQRDVKGILVVTQIALATSAFALGIVVSHGHIELWQLVIFAALEGTIIAFDMPAFYKVTPTLVPREDFQQALALNSVNFHLSRVVGPSIAGIIMGVWGTPAVFWINAVSFLGVVAVVARLPRIQVKPGAIATPSGMRDALKYIGRNPKLVRIFLQLALIVSVVFPLVFTTFRVYLQHKFNLDARQFGFVFSFPGLGALLGSFAFLLTSPKNPLKVLPYGLVGIFIGLGLIAEVQTLPMMVAALTFFSFCMFLSLSSLTVTTQLAIDHAYRGRISALVGLGFVSVAPIMSVPIGILSDVLGERDLLWGVAITHAVCSLVLHVGGREPTRLQPKPN